MLRTVTAGLILAATLLWVPASASATPPQGGGDGPIMVVLDTSESMNEQTSALEIRIDAARAAVLDMISALSSSDVYGLLNYPGGADDGKGCTQGKVVTPVGPLNHRTAIAQARGLKPNGDTPTGPALRHAADLLQADGYTFGTIVLVSDGESNCGDDPCEVAKSLRSEGFDVTVDTVGFEISSSGQDELKCVADATGGRYVPVGNGASLADALNSAQGGLLHVEVNMPTSLPVVTGGASELGTAVPLTVRNDGTKTAQDVRVSMLIGDTARVLVNRPVRFLGNLGPGTTRSVDFVARPDQVFEPDPLTWHVFTTSANSPDDVQTGTVTLDENIGRSALGALFSDVDRVVVLGDSYSSGEGAGDYTSSSSGTASNWCHRSRLGYGPVLFGEQNTRIIACSGAGTRDFTAQQLSHGQLMTPQLLALRAAAVAPDSPQAALLTIGGNDIGFADVVTSCLLHAYCQYLRSGDSLTSMGGLALRAAHDISSELVKVYEGVDSALNDPTAVAARHGQVAPIVVLPYVRIVPETSEGANAPGGCFLGFSSSEVGFLNQLIDQLNESIRWAVGRLRARGRPVYYVDEVVGAFQPQHTMCEKTSSFANYLSVDRSIRLGDLPLDSERRQELAHPTSQGYEAIARALATWSRSVIPLTSGPAPPYLSESQQGPGFWDDVGKLMFGVSGPGDTIDVSADGYAPGTRVVFTIQSVRHTLGTAVADHSGVALLTTTLPTDLQPGGHTVTTTGLAPDRTLRIQTQRLHVSRPGTREALATVITGIVLLLIGAGLMVIGRWRRRWPPVPAATPGPPFPSPWAAEPGASAI